MPDNLLVHLAKDTPLDPFLKNGDENLLKPRFDDLVETRAGPDAWVPWRAGGREVPRFYHLFADGELRDLVLRAGLRVERYFRTKENYAAVAERHA